MWLQVAAVRAVAVLVAINLALGLVAQELRVRVTLARMELMEKDLA
jgi:hypothetical protein